MKQYYLAAAALLAGTSALAWAPATDVKDPAVAAQSIDKPLVQDVIAAKDARTADLAKAEIADPEAANTGETDTSDAGVGGPLETAEASTTTAAAATELAPRPAAQNYPPCRAGPGDDNCIQLYEPGVRTALASWIQPTGGLQQPDEAMAAAETAGEPATGMGGPYEPVEAAMAGDGMIEPELGETEA